MLKTSDRERKRRRTLEGDETKVTNCKRTVQALPEDVLCHVCILASECDTISAQALALTSRAISKWTAKARWRNIVIRSIPKLLAFIRVIFALPDWLYNCLVINLAKQNKIFQSCADSITPTSFVDDATGGSTANQASASQRELRMHRRGETISLPDGGEPHEFVKHLFIDLPDGNLLKLPPCGKTGKYAFPIFLLDTLNHEMECAIAIIGSLFDPWKETNSHLDHLSLGFHAHRLLSDQYPTKELTIVIQKTSIPRILPMGQSPKDDQHESCYEICWHHLGLCPNMQSTVNPVELERLHVVSVAIPMQEEEEDRSLSDIERAKFQMKSLENNQVSHRDGQTFRPHKMTMPVSDLTFKTVFGIEADGSRTLSRLSYFRYDTPKSSLVPFEQSPSWGQRFLGDILQPIFPEVTVHPSFLTDAIDGSKSKDRISKEDWNEFRNEKGIGGQLKYVQLAWNPTSSSQLMPGCGHRANSSTQGCPWSLNDNKHVEESESEMTAWVQRSHDRAMVMRQRVRPLMTNRNAIFGNGRFRALAMISSQEVEEKRQKNTVSTYKLDNDDEESFAAALQQKITNEYGWNPSESSKHCAWHFAKRKRMTGDNVGFVEATSRIRDILHWEQTSENARRIRESVRLVSDTYHVDSYAQKIQLKRDNLLDKWEEEIASRYQLDRLPHLQYRCRAPATFFQLGGKAAFESEERLILFLDRSQGGNGAWP